MPRLREARAGCAVYGLARLDDRGRVADQVVMGALGWRAGTRLEMRECGGLVVVTADPRGVFRITEQGHLRVPAVVRHCCGLQAGDRVLLVADPGEELLAVHPPAALDAMIAAFHAGVLGGGDPR